GRCRPGVSPDLKVYVDGAALIPAWIDRNELNGPIRVGHLIAAQEFLAFGIETRVRRIRIDAQRVTMPDIHGGAGQRNAAAAVDLRNTKHEVQLDAVLHRTVGWVG